MEIRSVDGVWHNRIQRELVMIGDYIRRLSKTRFWLSKWFVALTGAAIVLLAGVVALMRSNISLDTFLNYFALGLLIFVVITLFYGIIAIHDIPYEIAVHRNHPHQDAIHAAGWVSLFTLHAIWPFLWIWAMLYRPDRGWGMNPAEIKAISPSVPAPANTAEANAVRDLSMRVGKLEILLREKGGMG